MATAPNVYTAEPASPVLAHSLLTPGSRTLDPGHTNSDTSNHTDWNLKEDWDTGIRSSDTGIFRCGTIIGFSRLRNRSKENDEYIGQVGVLSASAMLGLVVLEHANNIRSPVICLQRTC